MSSPIRDTMKPESGKLRKSDDTVFDLTTLLDSINTYLGANGIPTTSGGDQPTVPTAVTPSDSTDLTSLATKGIFVSVPLGVTTTVAFKLSGSGTAVTLPLYGSQYLPGKFSRVMSTNTTLNGATIVAYS